MNSTISLFAELPEPLHKALAQYVETHPNWDQDRTIVAALSLFLMQNSQDQAAARVYLETLFGQA
ncbi:DUF2811 domain-containing protein [Alkalinema sp. FACHB-956]|uniref:DUF2811 domain-containing protein n=1 Tax=Alkalinema sp. FACHB-956 TaxID=2692768 RepID=UPI001689AAD1|nr:DUF2811 domain-containing protein [Alkalinema sp. FACHB-956]MBD2329266.1 DUF2811 domain-containing protein [Alkalinema sp. FACHB-956]